MSTDTTAQASGAGAAPITRRSGLVLVLLCLAQFMVILDVSIVNVALPDIGASLELGREATTWVITAYTMTLGGLLILGGRLADSFGARTTFLVGLAAFTAASLSSGLAQDGVMLLVSRVGQGMGAALLSPAALSLLMHGFTGRDRDRALAVWAAIGGAGAAVGVLLGGALTAGPGWAWVFLVNVPVGVVVAFGVGVTVPAVQVRRTAGIDLPGAVIGTTGVALLIYALTRAGEVGWTSGGALFTGSGALLAGGLFVAVENRAVHPLVPARLLRRSWLAGGLVVMTAASAAMISTFFLTSMYLQRIQDLGPLGTGLAFLPATIAVVAGAHLAAHAITRAAPRLVGGSGLAIGAVGLAGMGWSSNGAPLSMLVAGLVVVSFGIGISFVTATRSGLTGIGDAHAGLASGVLTTGHEIGASLGVAVVSSLAAASLSGEISSVAGFERAYLVSAAATLVVAGLAATRLLPRERSAASEGLPMAH